MKELIICAIEQEEAPDLRPLFKYPTISLEVYLRLKEIKEGL